MSTKEPTPHEEEKEKDEYDNEEDVMEDVLDDDEYEDDDLDDNLVDAEELNKYKRIQELSQSLNRGGKKNHHKLESTDLSFHDSDSDAHSDKLDLLPQNLNQDEKNLKRLSTK